MNQAQVSIKLKKLDALGKGLWTVEFHSDFSGRINQDHQLKVSFADIEAMHKKLDVFLANGGAYKS